MVRFLRLRAPLLMGMLALAAGSIACATGSTITCRCRGALHVRGIRAPTRRPSAGSSRRRSRRRHPSRPASGASGARRSTVTLWWERARAQGIATAAAIGRLRLSGFTVCVRPMRRLVAACRAGAVSIREAGEARRSGARRSGLLRDDRAWSLARGHRDWRRRVRPRAELVGRRACRTPRRVVLVAALYRCQARRELGIRPP